MVDGTVNNAEKKDLEKNYSGGRKRSVRYLAEEVERDPCRRGESGHEGLANMSDRDLLHLWTEARRTITTGKNFSRRGWVHTLYAPILSGRRVLDVGCGFGTTGITLAQAGARITFLDIVEPNLHLVRRICEMLDVKNVDFFYLDNLPSLANLEMNYDVIWCQGSLITVPFEMARSECQELLRHLKSDAGGLSSLILGPAGRERVNFRLISGAKEPTEARLGWSGTIWISYSRDSIPRSLMSYSILNTIMAISIGLISSENKTRCVITARMLMRIPPSLRVRLMQH